MGRKNIPTANDDGDSNVHNNAPSLESKNTLFQIHTRESDSGKGSVIDVDKETAAQKNENVPQQTNDSSEGITKQVESMLSRSINSKIELTVSIPLSERENDHLKSNAEYIEMNAWSETEDIVAAEIMKKK